MRKIRKLQIITAFAALFFCCVRAANAVEQDITDALIASGKNGASIHFPIDDNYDPLLNSIGLVWAKGKPTPAGETSLLYGLARQLPGNSGFKINIPILHQDGYKSLVGMETNITLTPAMAGQKTFDEITRFLIEKHEAGSPLTPGKGGFMPEGGEEFYVFNSAKDLLEKYGISIMGLLQDGNERDISESFQCGVLYDTDAFDDGKIYVTFGPLLADSDLESDGAYELDLTETVGMPVRLAILYDGKQDDSLNFSFWLAGERRDYSESGGGCDAGAFAPAGMAILAMALIGRKSGRRDR